MTRTIPGVYGSHQTPCTVFIYRAFGTRGHGAWYAIEGSSNVNFTYDELTVGVDVETLYDDDTLTWPGGVDSEEELELAVEA